MKKAKKTFQNNPVMNFITAEQEAIPGQMTVDDYDKNGEPLADPEAQPQKPAQRAETGPQGIEVPKGWRITREPKTARLNLLIRPSLLKDLKKEAAARDISVTQLIDDLLTDALK